MQNHSVVIFTLDYLYIQQLHRVLMVELLDTKIKFERSYCGFSHAKPVAAQIVIVRRKGASGKAKAFIFLNTF